MVKRAILASLVLSCGVIPPVAVQAQRPYDVTHEFVVPEGFVVTQYADDDLAHDIFSLTVDARGRVVVAGREYIRVLIDDEQDGHADRAVEFASAPREGARGLCFDGPDLLCTGDDAVWRLRDRDGDDVADDMQKVMSLIDRGGHSSNGILQGPDGWFYVICGNDAGATSQQATTTTSPVREPLQGTLLRISPDGTRSEIVAHGFRNPYDLGFDRAGRIWTVDADGERDQYMPWYSPTRLFDIATGMHHGWVLPGWIRSWNRPSWLSDNVDRAYEIGRGSPTGLVVYDHTQFPESCRQAVFSCCWSLGRIYLLRPEVTPGRSTPKVTLSTFLEGRGNSGFAPVGLEVGPQGDLYVAIGGRGTRGGVFRIQYVADGEPGAAARPREATVDSVLRAPQPLSSWSRESWRPAARALGRDAFAAVVTAEHRSPVERSRAVEILVELFQGLQPDTLEQLRLHDPAQITGQPVLVLSRIAWALSRHPQPDVSNSILCRLTHHPDVTVQRAAWESLLQLPESSQAVPEQANWDVLRGVADRRVRQAALLVLARGADLPDQVALRLTRESGADGGSLAIVWRAVNRAEPVDDALAYIARLALQSAAETERKLEAVRLLQLWLGDVQIEPTEPDVYAGYRARALDKASLPLRHQVTAIITEVFPSESAELNRELVRLAGMLEIESPQLIEAMARQWSSTSTVEDDVHLLISLSLIPGERSSEVTTRTAAALNRLHAKMQDGGFSASRFWPQRVRNTYVELARKDRALFAATLSDPGFGRLEHALLADQFPDQLRTEAAGRLWTAVQAADEVAWSDELVRLMASLGPEQRAIAFDLAWDSPSARGAVAAQLARSPQESDRARFVELLQSGDPELVELAAVALQRLKLEPQAPEAAAAIGALRSVIHVASQKAVSDALQKLLRMWSGSPEPESAEQSVTEWEDWFGQRFPDDGRMLSTWAGTDLESWLDRLDRIRWKTGNVERGRYLFQQRLCAKCHAGAARLGPELTRITRRLAPRDLMISILDPNRDVSPAYRVSQVVTAEGKVVTGQIIYESPATTMVQVDAETTVRIAGEHIVEIRRSPLSPMPTGLLRNLDNRAVADLYAYLKSLDSEEGDR